MQVFVVLSGEFDDETEIQVHKPAGGKNPYILVSSDTKTQPPRCKNILNHHRHHSWIPDVVPSHSLSSVVPASPC